MGSLPGCIRNRRLQQRSALVQQRAVCSFPKLPDVTDSEKLLLHHSSTAPHTVSMMLSCQFSVLWEKSSEHEPNVTVFRRYTDAQRRYLLAGVMLTTAESALACRKVAATTVR